MSCKILIIDNDEDDVEILADAFTQSGVDKVHYEHSAMKAFIYLEDLPHDELPKLIITDLYLPGITGEEFLKDLKSMDKYKHIHVVILSSAKSRVDIDRYRDMGADDYLIKPSTYSEYVQVAADITSKIAI